MKKFKKLFGKFTAGEKILWGVSIAFITVSYALFGGSNPLSFTASLIGATALIFNAKGYPAGQVLMIVFCILYGIISFSFAYYGELITYIFMSLPMAIISLINWVKHPFDEKNAEVKVNMVTGKEYGLMFLFAAVVTVAFYFILKALGTANLLFSTVSVTTSFIAAYLTMRRSPFYAIGYAANDVVLIILWVMASVADFSYVSVVTCFIIFLVNDIYGFINWRKMLKRQTSAAIAQTESSE